MEVGATVHVLSNIGGVLGEWDAEITESIDNQSISWRTTSGYPTIIYHASIVPSKFGTKIITAFDYELPYSTLGKIVDKLRVHKVFEKDAERALQKIRDVAENGSRDMKNTAKELTLSVSSPRSQPTKEDLARKEVKK